MRINVLTENYKMSQRILTVHNISKAVTKICRIFGQFKIFPKMLASKNKRFNSKLQNVITFLQVLTMYNLQKKGYNGCKKFERFSECPQFIQKCTQTKLNVLDQNYWMSTTTNF